MASCIYGSSAIAAADKDICSKWFSSRPMLLGYDGVPIGTCTQYGEDLVFMATSKHQFRCTGVEISV